MDDSSVLILAKTEKESVSPATLKLKTTPAGNFVEMEKLNI